MATFQCCDQSISAPPLSDDSVAIYHSPGQKFHVTFAFTCKFLVDEWVLPAAPPAAGASENIFCGQVPQRGNRDACIRLDGHQFFNVKKAKIILLEKLVHWPLGLGSLLGFIDYVLWTACWVYDSMSDDSCNAIWMHFPVTIVHNHVYDERRAMDLAIRQSEEEDTSYMVPASESAIKSLKALQVPAGSADKCTVCLEEMKSGSEAVATPCSHVFHGDCIKQWLKISHHCPLCRFEMSTD